ncbi:hypothetical protein MIR68_001469 [Amoeboaphelidium protococcarum]|nr:hypothetical protein MIR68_001469 [Amoeboaphelidium protococcarum]
MDKQEIINSNILQNVSAPTLISNSNEVSVELSPQSITSQVSKLQVGAQDTHAWKFSNADLNQPLAQMQSIAQKYNIDMKEQLREKQKVTDNQVQNMRDFIKLDDMQAYQQMANLAKQQLLTQSNADQYDVMECWKWRIHALVKLTCYQDALEELQQLIEYPNISFTLRLYNAHLPALLGNHPEAIVRLLQLKSLNGSSDALSEQYDQQQQQRQSVLLTKSDLLQVDQYLIHSFIAINDYYNANLIVNQILKDFSSDLSALSMSAKSLLFMGNILQARKVFNQIEVLIKSQDHSQQLGDVNSHDILMINRSLLAMAEGDWNSAQTILTTLMSASPENMVAINNLCICMLYNGKLQESISLLESVSASIVNESVLFNLVTLYELASERNLQKRTRLFLNIASKAGDSFDYSVLKM